MEKQLAYKGFNLIDGILTCRNTKFEVGKIVSVTGKLIMCKNGFHFCRNINDIHQHYNLNTSVIGIIEVLGEVINDIDFKKSITNKLKLIKILTKEEVLKLSNTGIDNTGFINSGNWNSGNRNSGNRNSGNWNSGDCNSGNWNSGDCNSGDCNSGDWNSGNWNSGNYNSGNWNSGNYNSGNCNSGNWNSGNWNSGNYNSGNFSNGFFNSQEHPVFIFDKKSKMTPSEFKNSDYASALNSVRFKLTEWIDYTEEEKHNDKAKEYIGGYLKTYSFQEACSIWWSRITEENKKIIKSIPNFNWSKFTAITGIQEN